MPRQINPGKGFKRWVPTDKNPEPSEAVFPELGATDISDEEWDEVPTKEIAELKARVEILNQALYSVLMAMFNRWYQDCKTELRRQRLMGYIYGSAIMEDGRDAEMKEAAMRGTLLWQYYVKRIIETEPTGHYVSK